jgi:catechol 2,3-dioxygenase-like lactoylglutathione lyase family enzyme
MPDDLFAGIPVSNYVAARAWYERLFGLPPSFNPNDREAVWELAEHRYVFIEDRPEHAGHARHLVFVGDLDARVAQISERGLVPAEEETYANGVRKVTFRDADGNEFGFGGAPQ